MYGPSAKYFPVRPDLAWSISILAYDDRAFAFFFRVIKFAIGMSTYVAHFDRKVGIYTATRPDGFFLPCSALGRGFSQ